MEIRVPKICFISSCPSMAESICDSLAKEGFHVDWVRDTKQALDKLRHTEYAAVVSDIYRRDTKYSTAAKKPGGYSLAGQSIPGSLCKIIPRKN